MFEMKERAGLGRIGELRTEHGVVETPALMPVINPSNLVITPKDLARRFGVQILITNAYIIWKSEFRQRFLDEGIHRALNFHGPIMTDSGAFQQHVYGRVEVSNEDIVRFQAAVGADLGAVLDVFTEPDDSRRRCEEAVEETLRRSREALEWGEGMGLVGTVQGGLHLDLREHCARGLSDLPLGVHAIGGVVPLMERYKFTDLVDVIIASKKGLSPDRPVHLFGAGHPITFGLAVLLGCDLFDSAAYVKYAQDGRMITTWGTTKVEELAHVSCTCPACHDSSPEDLKADVQRLAQHNLYVSLQELEEVKQAIHEGSLWEHVERRCRAHPSLLDALKGLRDHVEFLERYEGLVSGTLFYTGPESVWRPVAHRFRQRLLKRYSPPRVEGVLILPEGRRPYSRTYSSILRTLFERANAHAVVRSALGPVPVEFDSVYPVAQSVVPDDLDLETVEASEVLLRQFLRRGYFSLGVTWAGDDSIDELSIKAPGPAAVDMDRQRVEAVANYQFGPGAADALLQGEIEFVKSKRTKKIRNVFVDREHILSMRARDGLFTLKLAGGKRLHEAFRTPKLRVVVDEESAPLNREGKNVFAKFVVECDDELRPLDEVLVVDEEDSLVAVGRALMNREEMLAFERGMAVKVREGSPLN